MLIMLTEIIPRQNKTTKAEKQQQEPSTGCLETFVFNVDFFEGGKKQQVEESRCPTLDYCFESEHGKPI